MPVCPNCSATLPAQSRFCPGCGVPVMGPLAATDPAAATRPREARTDGGLRESSGGTEAAGAPTIRERASSGPPAADAAMFAPGTVLARRFRIIARLGKGGMGEVYRADDLKLGQEVALKFLPAGVAFDERWLSRFKAEVRVARQVSHPNLCRVFDLDEVETPGGTLHFISMEYIDGEDLGSLLRRIGRLPKDKAVQVARQLCAGLSAAHAAGIIHRDLKPANIMLDGRGHARIADFGIAGHIGQIAGGDIRSGTPEYMAPEQLAGREVTVRSDIYCLGLVLYELFTGRRAGEESTVVLGPESRTRSRADVTPPSRHVDDLDPAVERTIMRCLEDDPAARPGSALSIAAALPGGDPLQAALQAGETPSPELVAAAGSRDAIKLRWALAIILPGLLAIAFMLAGSNISSLVNYIPLPKNRAVLADRARETLTELGFPEPADTADFFVLSRSLLDYIQKHDDTRDRWYAISKGRPPALRYLYRTSPDSMLASNMGGIVRPSDPPRNRPGMATIELDTAGRLNYLAAVPERQGAGGASTGAPGTAVPDWDKLFRLAGLDKSQFEEAEPTEEPPVPPHHAEHVAAWRGAWPGHFDMPMRVEAGWTGARPVYFALKGSWDDGPAGAPPVGGAGSPTEKLLRRIAGMASTLLIAAALVSAALLSRRNIRLGRGDRAGAARIAGALMILELLGWVATAGHVSDARSEWRLIIQALAGALLAGAVSWLLYMALEPFVRRRNPRLIIAWSRLLSGRWRDPLVGRDLMLGISAASLIVCLEHAFRFALYRLDRTVPQPLAFSTDFLAGPGAMLGATANIAINAVIEAMLLNFLFVALAALVRREWIAGVLFGGVLLISTLGGEAGSPVVYYTMQVIGLTLLVVVIARCGLLTLMGATLTMGMLRTIPLTRNLDQWYAHGTIAAMVLVGGLAALGFWSAIGGRLAFAGARPRQTRAGPPSSETR